jgi:hypothetical protein
MYHTHDRCVGRGSHIYAPRAFNPLSLHTSATLMTPTSQLMYHMSGKQLPLLLSCITYKKRTNRKITACKQATQCQWTPVSSSKLRGTVRIAQENNLQYIKMSRATTNLTISQTALHAHPKRILNPTHIRIMLAIATVITITTVNMMTIRFMVIAKTQTKNDG